MNTIKIAENNKGFQCAYFVCGTRTAQPPNHERSQSLSQTSLLPSLSVLFALPSCHLSSIFLLDVCQTDSRARGSNILPYLPPTSPTHCLARAGRSSTHSSSTHSTDRQGQASRGSQISGLVSDAALSTPPLHAHLTIHRSPSARSGPL